MFFSGERFLPRDQQVKAILLVLQISGNAESASPRFRAKCARPLSNLKAGSGRETTYAYAGRHCVDVFLCVCVAHCTALCALCVLRCVALCVLCCISLPLFANLII